jgi:hypothetical protein
MEKVAVVGSREGADLEAVTEFVRDLYAKYPDTVIVSGGAKGVDTAAEQTWLALGGRVISFRVHQFDLDHYGAEVWELGGANPRVYTLVNEPTWADYVSALFYRDLLIAEACDRLVLFHKPGWRGGGGFTADSAKLAYGKPTYEYQHA